MRPFNTFTFPGYQAYAGGGEWQNERTLPINPEALDLPDCNVWNTKENIGMIGYVNHRTWPSEENAFFMTNPMHYKYSMSCSSSDDGNTSCSLHEERVPFENGVEGDHKIYSENGGGIIHFSLNSKLALPTDSEIRPVNVSVKFMIKAK